MRYSLPLCLLQGGLFLQEEQCQRFSYSNQTNPLSLPDSLLQQKILVLRTPPLPQWHTSVSREGTQRYTGLKAPAWQTGHEREAGQEQVHLLPSLSNTGRMTVWDAHPRGGIF